MLWVVFAAEVEGRWLHEAHSFVCQLAEAKVCSVLHILKGRAIQAWHHSWCSLLVVLLGCDGDTPSLTSFPLAATCRSSLCEQGLMLL